MTIRLRPSGRSSRSRSSPDWPRRAGDRAGSSGAPAPSPRRGSRRMRSGGSSPRSRPRERVAPRIEGEAPHARRRLVVADRFPGLGVEEGHGAVLVADRERGSVGAERPRRERIAVAVQDPDRRGAAQERREQVGAGGERVVERGAGVGEQKRPVEAILAERLGPEPLGVGGDGRVRAPGARRSRSVRRPPRRRAGRRRRPGATRPAIDSPLPLCLALARRLALVEERALELVQL